MNGFNSVAAYYELFSDSQARRERELPLLKQWLLEAPGNRVIDLACGSGFHAQLLAEHNATVMACDLSPDMIAYARAHRPHPLIHYSVCDMRTTEDGPWDLAICLGNSLSLLNSPDDVANVFKRVHATLNQNGLFAVQLINYKGTAQQEPRHRIEERHFPNQDLIAVKNLIPHGNYTFLSLTFHVITGEHHETHSESAMLLHLSLEDLDVCAKQSGFHQQAIFGGFDVSPYEFSQSPDLIGLFRKQ